MKLATLSSIFLALATASFAAINMAPEASFEEIMDSLDTVDEGFLHLADDGVLRSYDGDQTTVLGYMALTAAQIQSFVGGAQGAEGAHYAEVYNGVDPTVGELANEEEMWNPSPQNRPPKEGEEWNAGVPMSANKRTEDDIFARPLMWCGTQRCQNQRSCLWVGCHYCIGADMAIKQCYRRN
ncbi:hypothetical protein K491DRAFT_684169 [Lophiostoma macrostomum CBS 122681]|uniref:Uncharacterized protein n=1 Tax=Lophiostoma macrostomum CBS 122681 TaxID=1314788 RepID=A0A6A6SS64_9PLEO|nr:hypothetical protein K491DRAFT_684169 [Lophiostoma macrostomum CBS 122681]